MEEQKNEILEKENKKLREEIATLQEKFGFGEKERTLEKDIEYSKPFPKVFAPKSTTVYYVQNLTEQNVDLYFQPGKQIFRIFENIPIGIAGGMIPEFSETSDPKVFLLSVGDGDMGWIYQNYYLIDTRGDYVKGDFPKVIAISTNNGGFLDITNIENEKNRIGVNFQGECDCKTKGNITLDALTLNKKLAKNLISKKTLTCFVSEDMLVPCHRPAVNLKYLGIDKDFRKIYFSVVGEIWENERKRIKWEEKYAFDIKNKIITIEEPKDLFIHKF